MKKYRIVWEKVSLVNGRPAKEPYLLIMDDELEALALRQRIVDTEGYTLIAYEVV